MRANLNMDGYKVPGAGLRYQTDQNTTEDRKSLTARADALQMCTLTDWISRGPLSSGYMYNPKHQLQCITKRTEHTPSHIRFGANDTCIRPSSQRDPLSTYTIIRTAQLAGEMTRIVLLAPPPVSTFFSAEQL